MMDSVDSNSSAARLAVEVRDVALSFGEVHVLNGLQLALAAGSRTALVGRSGSGKTSLLAILCGLLKPTAGRVVTLGHVITDLNEDELCRVRQKDIGVIFQHFHLIETMSALENTTLPLDLAGDVPPGEASERAHEVLAAVGLSDRLTHYPSQLSGGERQRVAIARAFVTQPQLLLADEPTGNLDDDTSEQVLEVLFQLNEQYRSTLLFVTHNNQILSRFDTVLQLQKGRLNND